MNLNTPPVEIPAARLAEQLATLRLQLREQPTPAADARRQWLTRLESLVVEQAPAFARTIREDFGHRSIHETQLLEVFPALEAIRHARSHVQGWMQAKRRFASLWFMPARTELRPQPLGVVGIIVPWNYPLLLALSPLASALAAGNRVMIKMSELTPRTGELLATCLHAAFPDGEVVVINGGPETGRAFSTLPFDHLLFTGSTQVGREVMKAAAEHLVPVTLELGGKSPAIVTADFPVDLAAERILFGKCLNAGQTCIAPDYVLLPESALDRFIEAARGYVNSRYPTLGDDFTGIINERHRNRLVSWLDEARSLGAQVVRLSEAAVPAGKLPPTLVTGAPEDCRLMRDEIFGPILPLVTYRDLDDAIEWVNRRPRPLALYVFSHDNAAIEQVLSRTVAGGVSVNETLMHISQEDLPFGGVGPSGMGHYHGKFGFDTFSKLKPVFHQSRFNGLPLFQPPYGRRFERLIRLLSRT